MEVQDECCYTLTKSRGLRKSQPPVNITTQAMYEHNPAQTPPGGSQRSILDFTSKSYQIDQNSEMNKSPLPGEKLSKVINALLESKGQEEPESSSTLSINEIPLLEADYYINAASSLSFNKSHRESHNHNVDHDLSSEASSQANLSDDSFEILNSHSDERNPYSLKEVATNSVEFSHLGINESHSQNGKNHEDKIHSTYLSCPNDPNGEKLKAYIKLRKEQMTLNIQPLEISKSFEKINEIKNSQLTEKFKNPYQQS